MIDANVVIHITYVWTVGPESQNINRYRLWTGDINAIFEYVKKKCVELGLIERYYDERYGLVEF